MRFLARLVYFFSCFACVNPALAQSRQLGTWRMYLPYNNVNSVYEGGDRIYCVTPYSLFTYEKSTGVIQTYDKSTGLSDVGILASNYDPSSGYLAIAYNDNNLDFIHNGTDIYNLPDIEQYSTSQTITLYSISFYNGNAYLSSSLGISVISLARMEISETFTISSSGAPGNVYSITVDGTNIYAATDSGVKYAPLASPNLQDFNSWHYLTGTQNIPAKKVSMVQAYNGKVYAVLSPGTSDSLYQYNGSTWTSLLLDTISGETYSVTSLDITEGNLYLSAWGISPQGFGLEGKMDSTGVLITHHTAGHSHPGGWYAQNGVAYEADMYNGFFINNQGNVQNIVPNGPSSANVLSLNVKNGVANVCPGGVNEIWGLNYNFDGFFRYQQGQWATHNQYNDPILGNYINIVTSATIQSRNKTYYGSYYSGLVEFDNASESISNVYDTLNSPLEKNSHDEPLVEIGALGVDQYDNLWMGNSGGNYPLKVLQADGNTWQQFQLTGNNVNGSGIQAIKRIIVDENNQIWAPCRGGGAGDQGGLLVCKFNEDNNQINYVNARMLTTGGGAGNLPSGNVWCVAEDHSGNIWAGTDVGVATFYCAASELDSAAGGGCDAEWIKVTLNGVVGYLFSTESVRALAVDAANRIWVGSTNGVWLISNDGQTTYLNFNSGNSPMPSSQVTDIAIDDNTGEVFIGTLKGLVSYQGDAADTCIGCKEALVYPNPVTPDYTGPIAIKGLVDNAYVKITDVSGTLIYQGIANGTQMIWDGKGYDGVRAKSGVYLVFSSSTTGKSRRVAKILVTN
jgi:Two component regulator propeller